MNTYATFQEIFENGMKSHKGEVWACEGCYPWLKEGRLRQFEEEKRTWWPHLKELIITEEETDRKCCQYCTRCVER